MRIFDFTKFNESKYQSEIDRILDKISKSGIDSISRIEKEILDRSGDKDGLEEILSKNQINLKGIDFKFTHDRNEIYGEEFRVWGNLIFMDKEFYGYLEGFPVEVGGSGFESYVFSLRNDLYYGIEQDDIEIPTRFHLHDLLEMEIGFLENDHQMFYDFLSRIWEVEKSKDWNMESVIDWFRQRGVRYP
jgi:hypothetical protein